MANDLIQFEFSVSDVVEGKPLSADTADLPTLRSLLEEAETLIKGDLAGLVLAGSRVRIENGSLKLISLISAFLAADLRADLARLNESNDLDSIQSKRAQILEHWQARTRRSPDREYSIAAPEGLLLNVSISTHLQHAGEKSWVRVEKYLTGKVVNEGGKIEPNIHLVLAQTGATLMISATEKQIALEKENHLYKELTLHVLAEEHLKTKQLRNVRLIKFLPQTSAIDEDILANLWRNGREAWRNVPSATEWVESIRGNG